ncbi:hypothetical protein Tco_0340604 [Tanacetum coccineum]
MGDENPIRTLGDYSKPSHEGYRNTIELPVGNNVILYLKYGLVSRTYSKKSLVMASRRTAKLRNDILMLQQHHGDSLSEAWTRFKDLLQKVPRHGIDLWLQYCMEDPEQAFVEYASSRTDEAGGKWYTFKLEQNNLGDTYNPSWKSHPNLRWRQPQNSQNNFSNPPNRFQPNGSIPDRSFNNNPQNFNNQSKLEGLVSNFMASQDARLSKFEADFKQQQSKMTNKIDTVLKAITDRIARALPSDTVKNPKLSTSSVLSTRSYPTKDPQCSPQIHSSINVVTICPKQPNEPQNDESEGEDREERSNSENIDTTPPSPHDPSISFITEKVRKLNSFLESSGWVPQSSDTEIVCTKGDEGEVMFIEIIRNNDDSRDEGPEEEGSITTEGVEVEYFDTFPTRSELAYHRKLDPREDTNRGVSNFTGRIKGIHVFVGNFTYVLDFMIVEDISSIIDLRLSQVIKQYNSLLNLEKEHTKSVYLRNEEDKRRGVEYVMSKILGFYKECLELGPDYATRMDDEGEVTLYLTRRNLEVLREFHWKILEGRFNQLSHVSSPLLSKPGEY